MKQVFDVLCITLGTPPKADDELVSSSAVSRLSIVNVRCNACRVLQKYTGPYLARDCFSLINDPRNSYDTLYTVDRLGNVHGGLSVRCK
jgi:bleomycin hydrolase